MKRVVSISLGSSKRNKSATYEILGEEFTIERVGTDGDLKKFSDLFTELDGKVDAMGIGGADRYLVAGKKRYTFKQIDQLVAGAKNTPVLDGSGLKHTLERQTIEVLQREGIVDFGKERALLMSAVDRFGMADALSKHCPDVIYGDLLFGLGLPIPVRSMNTISMIGNTLLPIITRLPFKWFYPTGEKQDERKPTFGKYFEDRSLICGDSLYILRYAPDSMPGRTILTQSVRSADLEFFKKAQVKRLITTTPVINGETFATNVMEACLVCLLGKGKSEATAEEYIGLLNQIGWKPNEIVLD